MNRLVASLSCCLLVLPVACKKVPAPQPSSQVLAQNLTPKPTENRALVHPPVKPTATQLASTVRVQVTFGAIETRVYPGAIIHHDEVASPMSLGNGRLVLAFLNGLTPEQLRNNACKFSVLRNRAGASGERESRTRTAQLLQLDEKTGVALLAYVDEFDCSLDVGFHLEKVSSVKSVATIIGAPLSFSGASELVPVAGSYVPSGDNVGRLQFDPPRADSSSGDSFLLVAEPDKLQGFVEAREALSGNFHSIASYEQKIPAVEMTPRGIAFGEGSGTYIQFAFFADTTAADASARMLDLRAVDGTDVSVAAEQFKAGDDGTPDRIRRVHLNPDFKDKRRWLGSLEAPAEEGQQKSYVLQPTWKLFRREPSPSTHGAPFVVTLLKKNGRVTATVQGIEDLDQVAAKARTPSKEFVLDPPVADFHEIAGGREVLMRSDGVANWKRFSFEKNDWLPLPKSGAANVYITGNLDSLFVLDKGAAEVRKYDLQTLQLVASHKLPTGCEYVAVLSGCNSAQAPLYILSSLEVSVHDPMTLARLDIPINATGRRIRWAGQEHTFTASDRFQIVGDGLLFSAKVGEMHSSAVGYACTNETAGVGRSFYDYPDYPFRGCGVSGAFALSDSGSLSTIATASGERLREEVQTSRDRSSSWLVPNSPVVIRITPAEDDKPPVRPALAECIPYFGTSPLFSVELPELGKNFNPLAWREENCFAFDPYSSRLGVLAGNRATWVVHDVKIATDAEAAVLLNWPDTNVKRGSNFAFSPLTQESVKFAASIEGSDRAPTVDVAGDRIHFTMARDGFASLQLLDLKLTAPSGKDRHYSIPIHLSDPQPPVLCTADSEVAALANIGASFKGMNAQKGGCRGLPSSLQTFDLPVREILGPVADHLVLVHSTQRVDFFSLKEKRIVGSIPKPEKASYYTGGEALFEYDSTTNALVRIAVPSGKRERSMPLPNGVRLRALSIGAAASSPLVLVIEHVKAQTVDRIDDVQITTTDVGRNLVVLDCHTLQAGIFAQPKPWLPNASSGVNLLNFGMMSDTPELMPCGQSGNFITCRQAFIVLGQKQSFAWPFPAGSSVGSLGTQTKGSLSGSRVFDSAGRVFTSGIENKFTGTGQVLAVSACGNYRLASIYQGEGGGGFEVKTVENSLPLFRVAQVSCLQQSGFTDSREIKRQAAVITEHGPLVLLSAGGTAMQIVDLDIPVLARELNPSGFHVISQPLPCMMEGTALDYQIEVNNAPAVAGYRIRNEMPGLTLSNGGLVKFSAPRQVSEPTRVNLSFEISGKNGQTVLHEFPIMVLPYPRAATPQPGQKLGRSPI